MNSPLPPSQPLYLARCLYVEGNEEPEPLRLVALEPDGTSVQSITSFEEETPATVYVNEMRLRRDAAGRLTIVAVDY